MAKEPPPSGVRGNHWPSLAVATLESFVPELPISVVVPYYEAPEALRLTLAAMEIQSYPRELYEVVVVDDGSRTPLEVPADCPLDVRVVYQEDRGFGLARARNNGVHAASHDVIVFLDCDMMPESDWLVAHARWHHAVSDALTIGFRRHVSVEGIDADAVRTRPASLAEFFSDRPSQRPEWIESHMVRTANLTSEADDLFRVVTGGNLGVSRGFFETLGGYDETFTQWGAEDIEFGYRAFTRGGLLVPERYAMCWHQGEGASPSEVESASLELQRAKISHLIAHHGFRRDTSGRSFTVPQYVVAVQRGAAEAQLEAAEKVLASTVHDLVVWIEEPSDDQTRISAEYERVRRLLAGDPRVRFGAAGTAPVMLPAAQFHVLVPAEADLKPDTLARLRNDLGSKDQAIVELADGCIVKLIRARALHRAARTGEPIPLDEPDNQNDETVPVGERVPIDETAPVGDSRDIAAAAVASAVDPSVSPEHSDPLFPGEDFGRDRLRKLRKGRRIAAHVAREARLVRRPADARRLSRWFLSWASKAINWRVRRVLRRSYWRARRVKSRGFRVLRLSYWRARRVKSRGFRVLRLSYWRARRVKSRGFRVLRLSYWRARRVKSRGFRVLRLSYWRARRVKSRGFRVLRLSYWRARRVKSRGFRVLRRSYRQAPRTLRGLVQGEPEMQSATYRLGPEIAVCGPKATAVFAASSWVSLQVDPTVEVILADEPTLAPDGEPPGSVPVLFLADMDPSAQTPAFDAEQANPRNWSRQHRRHAAALGSTRLLPEPDRVRRVINSNRPAAGRLFHHIEDIAAYHANTAARAGTLATFAAFGALVHVAEEDPQLRRYLGSSLYSLMADPRIVIADERMREALSIALRREALRNHSLRARARQVLNGTDLGVPPLPLVAVLLATRRPERLRLAVEAVALQSYPRIELVIAMHGTGFDHVEADRLIADLAHPARRVQVPSSAPLGEVLNTAVRASTGALLTKFDDDDIYGPEHIWDLVLGPRLLEGQSGGQSSRIRVPERQRPYPSPLPRRGRAGLLTAQPRRRGDDDLPARPRRGTRLASPAGGRRSGADAGRSLERSPNVPHPRHGLPAGAPRRRPHLASGRRLLPRASGRSARRLRFGFRGHNVNARIGRHEV